MFLCPATVDAELFSSPGVGLGVFAVMFGMVAKTTSETDRTKAVAIFSTIRITGIIIGI